MAYSWPSTCTKSSLPMSFPVEQRPRMLKDFLTDDSNSCSSNGFRSIFRKPCNSNKKAPPKLQRSRSKAASTTISAIHKASEIMVNVVKLLPFASVKPPSILPRSISRSLSKRNKHESNDDDDVREISITVKVKDILRWKSFRDLVEEKPPPLDFSSSPNRCTTTTTTTGSTSTATSSSSSSWCDSDFTAEDLQLWCRYSDEYTCENEVGKGKKILPEDGVGGGSVETTTGKIVDPQVEEMPCEEKEQHSPVSVLDFSLQEDEEKSFSSFHQSLANMERRKCMFMQKLQEFECLAELENRFSVEDANGEEEKAEQLLNHVKTTSLRSAEGGETNADHLLLDFFRQELISSRKQKNDDFEREMLRLAKAWISGEDDGLLEREMEGKNSREVCVREMERGERWNKFEEEKEEMALEMETEVLSYLVDELLIDILHHGKSR